MKVPAGSSASGSAGYWAMAASKSSKPSTAPPIISQVWQPGANFERVAATSARPLVVMSAWVSELSTM